MSSEEGYTGAEARLALARVGGGTAVATSHDPQWPAPLTSFAPSDMIQGGVPVFTGTRVPVVNLMDYLAAGQPLDAFLKDFPSVSGDQAMKVLRLAQEALVASAGPS